MFRRRDDDWERISITISKKLLDDVDRLRSKLGFASRSEFIRYIIRRFMEDVS